MATEKSGRGRPRLAQKWESMMRYNLFLSFASDPDVHTALHLAGSSAPDLLIVALREYIERHAHPAGQSDVQARTALAGLGMSGIGQVSVPAIEPAVTLREQPASLSAPAPVPTPAMDTSSRSESALMSFACSQLDDA